MRSSKRILPVFALFYSKALGLVLGVIDFLRGVPDGNPV
jgi:hypothetical protein